MITFNLIETFGNLIHFLVLMRYCLFFRFGYLKLNSWAFSIRRVHSFRVWFMRTPTNVCFLKRKPNVLFTAFAFCGATDKPKQKNPNKYNVIKLGVIALLVQMNTEWNSYFFLVPLLLFMWASFFLYPPFFLFNSSVTLQKETSFFHLFY